MFQVYGVDFFLIFLKKNHLLTNYLKYKMIYPVTRLFASKQSSDKFCYTDLLSLK